MKRHIIIDADEDKRTITNHEALQLLGEGQSVAAVVCPVRLAWPDYITKKKTGPHTIHAPTTAIFTQEEGQIAMLLPTYDDDVWFYDGGVVGDAFLKGQDFRHVIIVTPEYVLRELSMNRLRNGEGECYCCAATGVLREYARQLLAEDEDEDEE